MPKQNQKTTSGCNRFFLAAAGTGKTSRIVKEALLASRSETSLLTTYTLENRDAIKAKLNLPADKVRNLEILTWWSFLLKHGVRPYQSVLDGRLDRKSVGFCLVNGESGKRYPRGPQIYGEKSKDCRKILRHYFNKNMAICSDKIAKFVVKVNEETKGLVVDRLAGIYDQIYIDEAQDLAGYDLEIIKLLAASPIRLCLVGDPRQNCVPDAQYQKISKVQAWKVARVYQ